MTGEVDEDRVAIPGSAPASPGAPRRVRAADADEQVEVTLVLRRPAGATSLAEDLLSGRYAGGRSAPATREQVEQRLRAEPQDVDRALDFARRFGLRVVQTSAEQRSVRVAGTVQQMDKAFGIRLEQFEQNDHTYRSHQGEVTIPRSLDGIVIAVLGLDDRPVARPA